MKRWYWGVGSVFCLLVGIFIVAVGTPVAAQEASGFALQVTPSPLVATVKPGQTTELELKIRNAGVSPESLKIAVRSFTLGATDGTVKLDDTGPASMDGWVSFSNPTFTIQPGQWFTEKVKIAMPKDSGFSYSFALLINRANVARPTEGGRLIEGSVAVFTLINVDRPGASRKLDITELSSSQTVYEYLPANISIRLKNTGNTIVQPYGNIFIQHDSKDNSPLAILPVNEQKGYILPGSVRTLSTSWDDGFSSLKTNPDGTTTEVWDWSKIGNFRIGQYTAKLVGVYDDGTRDVPIEGDITFWVIPWKIILTAVVILGLVLFGVWSVIHKIVRLSRRIKSRKTPLEP